MSEDLLNFAGRQSGKDLDSSLFPQAFSYRRISETVTEISLKDGFRWAKPREASLKDQFVREAFYRYVDTQAAVSNYYVHLKTNIPVSSDMYGMFVIRFTGYSYSESKPIATTLGFYSYGATPAIIGVGSYGSHVVTAVKTSDNMVEIVLGPITTFYFVEFICDQIAGPQGLVKEVAITAATRTASAAANY